MSMTSNLFRRSMTSIDRFRKAKPVAHKSRRSRASIVPGIDNLDERVLMAGNVITSLDSITGTLYIKGDNGNNSIQVSVAPDTTKLRIQGTFGTATAVNGVAFRDWTMSNFTKLVVQFDQGGKDVISLNKFKIATSITITTAGTGDDKISLDSVTTNTLAINSNVGQLPKSDIKLTNDTVGSSLTVNTGNGNDSIVVSGGKLGAVSINTGDNLATYVGMSVPVDAVDFSPISAKAVSIIGGTGDHAINVVRTTVSSLVICTGDADSGYVCDCLTLHTNTINVSDVLITKSIAGYTLPCVFPGDQTGTILDGQNCPPSALYICAGNNTDIIVDSVTAMSGEMNIVVANNTWAPEFEHVSQFVVVNSQTKSMHFNVGDGDYNIQVANSSTFGGTGFTLNTQGTLGTGDKNILLVMLDVNGDYDSTYGDSVFVVIVSGNSLSNNTVAIDTVNVDVTSPVFSFIWGNLGPLNTFVDYNFGSSSGFDVDGFNGGYIYW